MLSAPARFCSRTVRNYALGPYAILLSHFCSQTVARTHFCSQTAARTRDLPGHRSRFNSVTQPLYDLILQKKTHYPLRVIEAQIQAKKQIHKSKQQQTQDTAANLLPQLSESSQRSMVLTQEKGASSWLTKLPISEHGFALHKGAFRDALALRYGWDPPNTPSHCICGKSFTVEHALSCPFGGFPTLCHNEIRNLTANLLSEVCRMQCNYRTNPTTSYSRNLQTCLYTITDIGARSDIAADGFWGGPFEKTFFDVRVLNHLLRLTPHPHPVLATAGTKKKNKEHMSNASGN